VGFFFYDRVYNGLRLSDAIGFKGCREIEGPYVDYLEQEFGKHVLLSGPVLPELPKTVLDEKWGSWLAGFKDGSLVYCSLGSESKLSQKKFHELLLGFELTIDFGTFVCWLFRNTLRGRFVDRGVDK